MKARPLCTCVKKVWVQTRTLIVTLEGRKIKNKYHFPYELNWSISIVNFKEKK